MRVENREFLKGNLHQKSGFGVNVCVCVFWTGKGILCLNCWPFYNHNHPARFIFPTLRRNKLQMVFPMPHPMHDQTYTRDLTCSYGKCLTNAAHAHCRTGNDGCGEGTALWFLCGRGGSGFDLDTAWHTAFLMGHFWSLSVPSARLLLHASDTNKQQQQKSAFSRALLIMTTTIVKKGTLI